MARTVSVKLQADVAQYKRELSGAAKATRTLTGELDQTGRKATTSLAVMADRADDAAQATEHLADRLSRVARGDALGKVAGDFEEATRHAEQLDRQVAETEAGIKSLAKAYANTGDVKLFAQIKEQQRTLSELRNVRKALPDPADFQRVADGADNMGDVISDAAEQCGQSLAEMAEHAQNLDKKIENTEAGIRQLAAAFASTGDSRFLAQIKEHQRALAELRNVRKMLPDPAEILGVGSDMAEGVTKGFGARLAGMLPGAFSASVGGVPVAAIAAPAGIALAGFLGAAVSGAIIGSAGAQGIIGGLQLAARDQRVKNYAKAIGDLMLTQLEDSAKAMVPAAMDALSQVQVALQRMDDDLDDIFAYSAGNLGPLTRGITGLAENVVPALREAIVNARPVMVALSQILPALGHSIGTVFKSISDNGPEAAIALKQLFGIITTSVQATGMAINALTEVYGFAARAGLMGRQAQHDFIQLEAAQKIAAASADKAADSEFGFVRALEETAKAAAVTTQEVVEFRTVLNEMTNKNLSAAEATLALETAFEAAGKAIDKKRLISNAENGALITLARQINTTTDALDENGRSVGQATAAHETNRKKLIQTATQMGYTKTQAKKLADMYLNTPKNVTTPIRQPGMPHAQLNAKQYQEKLADIERRISTHVKVTGDGAVRASLNRLLAQQASLRNGTTVAFETRKFNSGRSGLPGGYAQGGWTGPGHTHQPAGVVHADEYVIRKTARRRIEHQHPGLLDEMNATGQVPPGYARGGMVAPFPVDVSKAKIPTYAQVMAAVMPRFGDWPSSPGAQRGDSGVWRRILTLIKAGPDQGSFGNAYRPGDPKWHGSGRAVDWMGYNMDALARYLVAKRPLEFIHRTNQRDYAYTRGRNMGSFNNALMEAHRNHIHIAMANGGTIGEPVVGVGRSGATYSFGERGPERVVPMGSYGGGGGGTVVVNVQAGYVVSEQQLEDKITATIDDLRRKRRL